MSWAHVVLRWLYVNVIVGGLGIILTILLTSLMGSQFELPSDFVLAISVLAMTIAAANADGLVEFEVDEYKRSRSWLSRLTQILVIGGVVLTVLNTLRAPISPWAARWLGLALLVGAIGIGIVSHLLYLRSRDKYRSVVRREAIEAAVRSQEGFEDFATQENRLTQTVQEIAGSLETVDNVRV